MIEHLLHPELITELPFTGKNMADGMRQRVDQTIRAAVGLPEPSYSVVIRSRNNADMLESLIVDVQAQESEHEPEIIVVDNESTDGSPDRARAFGATVLTIESSGYSHPRSLNMGFTAASGDWILSLVEHSNLVHDQTFTIAKRWNAMDTMAGISGISFAGANASRSEKLYTALDYPRRVHKDPYNVQSAGTGRMATNTSFFKRDAWRSLGRFDESYGSGGEDGALLRKILRNGLDAVVDPAMAVFHSHGLGPINSLRQIKHWTELGNPAPFDLDRLTRYRKDLQK